MPYEIPDSWCWTRLKSISTIINGYAFKKQDFKSFGKFKIIKIGNITTKGLDLSKCDFTDYNPGEAFTPTQGDLLIALSGATTGKMCFYNLNNESCFINQRTCIMRFLSHRFIKPALYSYFASTKTKEILDNSYGGAQPNISSEKIENMLVPLVPIKEQIRIDKTLSACLNKINEIEDRQKELLLLKNAIRNKIINLGINGKLLSSDDNYYSKNIKLKDCGKLLSGRDLELKFINNEKIGIPYITGASQISDNNNLIINRWTNYPTVISQLHDVLITVKGTIGKTAINNVGNIHIARQIMAFKSGTYILPEYVLLAFQNNVNSLNLANNSLIPGIKRDNLLNIEFPLFSIQRQREICSLSSKCFELLDTI